MITAKTYRFLSDLKKNNDRAWFKDHEAAYREAKGDVEALVADLIARIAAFDPEVKGVDARKCVFRIFRDARFSKDKSPYKSNFGAHISGAANKYQSRAGYYLHIEPGGSFLGGGAYTPPADWLKAIRGAIDRDGGSLKAILAAAAFKKHFGAMQGETLKTAPQGYPPDHLYIGYLRHKSFLALKPLKDREVTAPGFAKEVTVVFKAMRPFNRFLNEAFED